MFYVYCYFDPFTSGEEYGFDLKPFYIGKGQGKRVGFHLAEARRESNTKKQNNLKINKIKKIISQGSEPVMRILFGGLSEDEAKAKEIELIAKFGTRQNVVGVKRGPLCNLTSGGDGTSGHKFTDEQKTNLKNAINSSPNRLSKIQKSADSHRGRKHTDEHRKKISESNKGKKNTEEHIAKYTAARIANGNTLRSDETKKKISEKLLGHKQRQSSIQKRLATNTTRGFDFRTSLKSWIVLDLKDSSYIKVKDLPAFCKNLGLDCVRLRYTSKSKKEHKKQPGYIIMLDR